MTRRLDVDLVDEYREGYEFRWKWVVFQLSGEEFHRLPYDLFKKGETYILNAIRDAVDKCDELRDKEALMSERYEKIEIPGAESANDLVTGGLPITYSEVVPKNEVWMTSGDGKIVKFKVADDG